MKLVGSNYHFFEPVVWPLQLVPETWVVGTYLSVTLMRLPTPPGHMPRAVPRARAGARFRTLCTYHYNTFSGTPETQPSSNILKSILLCLWRGYYRVLRINSEAALWHIFPRKVCNHVPAMGMTLRRGWAAEPMPCSRLLRHRKCGGPNLSGAHSLWPLKQCSKTVIDMRTKSDKHHLRLKYVFFFFGWSGWRKILVLW